MNQFTNDIGVQIPNVLLPAPGSDFSKWAVVACDQFTSQLDYWEQADSIVGSEPSTLRLILPEAYLGKPGEAERIETVKRTMRDYLAQELLQEQGEGFVLVRRSAEGKERIGLVMALDLEQYDYNRGATSLIRATEGTIVDRIPPRLRIRADAPIELPHILVLIDDPERTVIEPIAAQESTLPLLYDTDLMLNGGHITGRHVNGRAQIEGILAALKKLKDPDAFAAKYGAEHAPLLFAMGDGNHSFATAKAAWEQIKATLPAEAQAAHPARYALVEIENVHDAGIVFEPIHRALFHVQPEETMAKLLALLQAQNGAAEIRKFASREALVAAMQDSKDGAHMLPYYFGNNCGIVTVDQPKQQLPVGTLQQAIDALLKEMPAAEVDYIHGDDVALQLAAKQETISFLLPPLAKSELFKTVVYDGALPRKTFSMGEANEKRYYMECRRILPQ